MDMGFRDVTVPVDASMASRSGVEYAMQLGGSGATLHFCSVVDAAVAYGADAPTSPINPAVMIEAMQRDAQAMIDEAVSAAARNGVVADGKVVFGATARAIARYAGEIGSYAVVVGTHARTGIARALTGSVAENLMRESGVPVVVTHEGDSAGLGPIVVAVDGSPAATAALHTAVELARAQNRKLAIHAVGETAELVLRDASEFACVSGVDFDLVALDGDVADTIIASAQRLQSPLIVVGTRGRADLTRLLLGSVAAAIVERAHVPVVVVRARSN